MLQSVRVEGERPSSTALRALSIVAQRLGLDTSLDQLQRSFSFGSGEPAGEQLAAIARETGLEAKLLQARWPDLSKLKSVLPAILRLRTGAYLLLEAFRDEDEKSSAVAILRDPASPADALVQVDRSHLESVWGGDILIVKRRFAITDEAQPFGFRWLLGQVARERRLFIDIGMAALISTIFAIAPPFIFMIVIDRVLVNHSWSTLNVVAGVLVALIVFETILGYLRRLFTEIVTTRIDGRLNLYILERLMRLPMDYFERNPTGMIMSKLGRMWQIRHFLTGELFGAFLDTVPLLGLIPVMLILEWRLALLVIALAAIVFVVVLGYLKPLSRAFHRVVLAEQKKGAHLVESVYGMRTVKSLALESRRRYEWDSLVAEATQARHAMGLLANQPQTMSLPFERLMYSGSFVVGAYLILSHPDTIYIGGLVAFVMLSMRLGQPMIKLAKLQQDLAEVRGALAEVASIMNSPPEEGRSGRGLRTPIRGAVKFQSLSFRYSAGAPLALDDVSFEISQGAMFGVMGRSGSGKTTVTRLLQGLHKNYEGIIKIDGMDLREIDLDHLRTSIGVVPQENFLFRGTIRENIAMARPHASFAEIVQAAQLAGAEEFIERFPRGYETYLEEGAVNLSGGQRQRLAIARALIIEPPILVFDEATSALDAESETIINANLQRMAAGRTIICISHRLSMLVPCDAILVLERGRVYDIGRHEELLMRCDIYKHMWHQQNRYAERTTVSHVHLPSPASI